MSFQAMAWAVRQKLPCTQKIVLMMLAERHNQDSGQCNPSHDRLADDCGLTRRSVMDQVAKLAEAGYIRIRHRAANNVKLPNQYVLVFSFGAQEEVKDCAEVVNDVRHPVVKQVHHVVNHVPLVVQQVHQGSEPVAHKPGIEPGIEPKEKKSADAPPLFVLPNWINKSHWDAWHSIPKRKNATPEQKQLAVDKLKAWKDQGIDHAAALENAAVGGWQGLFKPDDKRPPAVITGGRAPQAESFAERDARNGRERWSAMTGREWPADELPGAAKAAPMFIDVDATEVKRLSK